MVAMGELEKYIVPCKPPRMNQCVDCVTPISECPWLSKHEPVPGWTATKRTFVVGRYQGGRNHWTDTYVIEECPLFVRAKKRKTSKAELTEAQSDFFLRRKRK